ncbi:hypothetical protein UJ101_01080 [Flavobacteriaceae bacterium UJ101]|nr:hypothetical protein UJ101_01080 [Flavobacteriaceae bacterium UJ101]
MKMDRSFIDISIYRRLPEELKKLTQNFEGREKDIVLLSSLGVLSNCLPNFYGVYDGDDIYAHLYVMIIAPPASGKGVMNYSRALIEPIHDRVFEDSKNAYRICDEENKGSKKVDCPAIRIKLLPANISTSEMYSYLDSSKNGLLIMESEADTMSNMLKNDWSNYSDVLRKAFHHEPISISRKVDKIFVDIKGAKLAMVVSGTPDQLQPLIKSKENGLFSRFIIYNFDEVGDFKDVFAEKTRSHKEVFEEMGQEISELYDKLENLSSPIEFIFTEAQQQKFLNRIKPIRTAIIENYSEGFVSNLHRHGLILFRIAMILTAIRNKNNLHEFDKIECNNIDFMVALKLMQTLLGHSQFTYDSIDDGILSLQDGKILSDLGESFSTQEAYEVGENYGVPNRTMIDKLLQWKKKRIIKRVKKGHYKVV